MLRFLRWAPATAAVLLAGGMAPAAAGGQRDRPPPDDGFHDVHFHLTDYVQRDVPLPHLLRLMGDRVGRVALSAIPLQQKWDWFESGDRAPDYYLRSDAALYYYSFADAVVAAAYSRLSAEDQERFDPMISGFNPTDMYAVEHVRRVLRAWPGVFSGIGEVSIHKEFVSAKIAGHAATLRNPALGRILDFAGEVGLVVLLHNDVNTVLPRPGEIAHAEPLKRLFAAHPATTIIWAHAGLGRFVEPTADHVDLLRSIVDDDRFAHVHFDVSWDLVADYIVADDRSLEAWSRLMNDAPDRFLFGSDAVAPEDEAGYFATWETLGPLWERLDVETGRKIRHRNYQRLFDEANRRVRKWEAREFAPDR